MNDTESSLRCGWLDNPHLDVTTQINRAAIADALKANNIAFGLHRWYYGGSSPDAFVISTMAQWDDEISGGRPGDNLMLVSLGEVAHQALMHLGHPSGATLQTLTHRDLQPAWSLLESTTNELFAVTRHVTSTNQVGCSIEILWDPSPAEQAGHIGEWRKTPGELWLFSSDVVWQPETERRELPKSQWTPRHGHFLLDAYIPDPAGRVPEGGAY